MLLEIIWSLNEIKENVKKIKNSASCQGIISHFHLV